jgi:hypothetical protein
MHVLFVLLQYDASTDLLYRLYLGATVIGVVGGLIGLRLLYKQLVATQKAADAAKASADHIMNSERAWVFLDIDLLGSKVWRITTGQTQRTRANFSFRCRNVGKSPAWITAKIVHFQIYDSDSPPKLPDIESLGRFEYGPEPMDAGGDKTSDPSWETDGTPGYGKFSLVLGVVKYHDIFGEHITVCGYSMSTDEKKLERIAGSDYNQYT